MKKTFEEFKTDVLREVKKRYKLKEVCMDGLHEYYDRDDFEGAVKHAQVETAYWEGDF